MNIIDSFRLDDRVAVVTGAGKGIGEGIAVGLAEAGADLALVARTRSDLERVAPAAPYHAGLDAEHRDRVQAGFLHGGLEIVVATIAVTVSSR